MKTFKLFILFCFLSSVSTKALQWTQKKNFSGNARYASAFFSIGNKGYICTGYDGTNPLNDFWEYDPTTDTWAQKANFGGAPRFHAACFSIGTKAYVGLGSTSYPIYNFPVDFWEWDQTLNVWNKKNNFPGPARYASAFFSLGAKGYLACGWDKSTPFYNDFWEYDPSTDSWLQHANFPGAPRSAPDFYVQNGKAYVGGGGDYTNVYQDFWEYDPAISNWIRKADMPYPSRFAGAGFSIGGLGYVGLGSSTYPTVTYLNDVLCYNLTTDSWSQINNFPGSARYAVATFTIGCKAYIATGEYGNGQVPRTFEKDVWEVSDSLVSQFTLNNSPICLGDSINVTNNSIGGTGYLWDFGDGVTSASNNSSLYHKYTIPGTYTVRLTVANSCGQDTMSKVVVVNPVPVLSVSSSQILCFGSTTFLTAGGAQFYTWTPALGLGNTNTANTTASPTNSTTYTVVGTNPGGCSISDTIHIDVKPIPVVTTSSDTSVCTGSPVQLTSSGGSSYSWTPSTYLDNPNISNPLAMPLSTTTYSLSVTNGFGCVNNTKAVTITVGSFSLNVSPSASVCQGSGTPLNATGGVSYSWSPSAGLSDTTIANPIATPLSTTNYSVIASNGSGCTGFATILVTVEIPPTANAGQDLDLCAGDSKQLHATGGLNYSWFPATGLNNPFIADPIATLQSTTSYIVSVTNGPACPAATDTINITFHPLPNIVAETDTTVFGGEPVQLIAYGTGINYQWSPSTDLSCTNCQNPIATPYVTTYYVATTIDSFGCRASDTVLIKIDGKFTLYVPNAFSPHSDIGNSIFYAYGVGVYNLEFYVFNRWGEEIFTSNDLNKGWDGTYKGRDVQEGVYVFYAKARSVDGKAINRTGSITVWK